jgi:hypothetical protein
MNVYLKDKNFVGPRLAYYFSFFAIFLLFKAFKSPTTISNSWRSHLCKNYLNLCDFYCVHHDKFSWIYHH